VYDIDIIRELESGKIRKAGLACSALTFAVSVAVKPATIYIRPTISINYTQIKHELRSVVCELRAEKVSAQTADAALGAPSLLMV
jgi:hypothetical protein